VGEATATGVLGLGAVGVVIALLVVAMGEGVDAEADAVAVCTSSDNFTRVDDSQCGDFGDDGGVIFPGGYHYMIFDTRTYHGDIPAVGQKMPVGNPAGYVRTYKVAGTGKVVGTKVPATGGKMSTISRGGFGVPAGVKAGTSGGTSGGS
jgi:hypothetical protein